VALLELGTLLLAFGGMAAFFAWSARSERRRLRAATQKPVGDPRDYNVLVVELDVAPSDGSPVGEMARILRAV
jgi:hypothetical protein